MNVHISQEQNAVVAVVSKFGAGIAKQISGLETKPSELNVRILKTSESAIVLAASTGHTHQLVKIYLTENKAGVTGFDRETGALIVARESGLTPHLLSYSLARKILIMEFIQGQSLAEMLTAGNCQALCFKLGRWLARFGKLTKAPVQPQSWHDYLIQCGTGPDSEVINQSRAFLQDFLIEDYALAKNDSAPGNWVVTPQGEFKGIDFEFAAHKPYGWDLLLTARSMVRLFPQFANELCEALCKGFCQSGAGRYDQFLALSKIFVAHTLSGPERNPTRLDTVLRAFNEASGRQLSLVVNAPYLDDCTERPDASLVQQFEHHLASVADQAWDDVDKETGGSAARSEEPASEPNTLHQAICTSCKGWCCSSGREKHAYIDRATIGRLRTQRPDLNKNDAVSYYLERLPDQSVTGSCLFHGKNGCGLPFETRSDRCRSFSCNSAKQLLQRSARHGFADALIIATENGQQMRATLLENGKITTATTTPSSPARRAPARAATLAEKGSSNG
ncbi:hypothetical protein [Candidatus Halocynthiibacter alkanivorans]|uniref:hypothetical protein n=1 Tax=Candidatus Halocynthiibacter alkanivorans TaxID=2267619 RepID=UPI000DF2B8BC|nr:hypothetical protein [Candidatus Halocynthiibacter alkanivorans]